MLPTTWVRGILGLVMNAIFLLPASCFGVAQSTTPTPPTGQLTPTTTLQVETGNNTSAADDFAGGGNGNTRASNVSKQSIRSLLYAGATTQLYAHMVGWFGGTSHLDVRYKSDDPAQVHRQVQDMISRGFQGAIMDWHGPASTRVNDATIALQREAEASGGSFGFAVMEDSGALFEAARANGCDVTSQFLSDLNFIRAQFENSPAYVRVNGKPVVFLFGVNGFYIDWDRVQAETGGAHLFVERGSRGLTADFAQGAFQWVDLNSNDPFDQQLAAQSAFYTSASSSSRYIVGSTYKGFGDTLAEWSTNRFIDQQCGQTWIASFNEIANFYSPQKELAAMQVVTWNDYEEGTSIESGIDNCVYVVPTISGNTLVWTVNGGMENTIDHFTVFASSDGQNLQSLADVPADTHQLDLSQFNLGQSGFFVFVKAVGKASIQNKMSPTIAFRPGATPPTTTLAIQQNGPLSITASVAGSSAPDGAIASSTIDFGDGTKASGPTASHTYAGPEQYDVTATVVDNRGASAVATERITVKPTTSGVTLFTPPNPSTVNWPTQFVATANSNSPITSMSVLVDGEQVYATRRDVVNVPLKVFTGSHNITVQAQDATGAVFSASQQLLAEPNDQPPTANITFRQLPGKPNTILACSVNSSDPDGFILKYTGKFSDGTEFFTPAAVHTFAAPGPYSAEVTVMDQFGATATTSQGFNVSGSALKSGATLSVQPETRSRVAEPIRRP